MAAGCCPSVGLLHERELPLLDNNNNAVSDTLCSGLRASTTQFSGNGFRNIFGARLS